MRERMREYRAELCFAAAEILLVYGATKLYALLYRPLSWDDDILVYIRHARGDSRKHRGLCRG